MLPDIDRITESAICTPFISHLLDHLMGFTFASAINTNIPIYFDCAAITNVNCFELIKSPFATTLRESASTSCRLHTVFHLFQDHCCFEQLLDV